MRKAEAKLLRWKADPLAYVREDLGVEPDAWQAKALQAFPTAKRIAIGAAKGPGKTALEAWLALNFLMTRPESRVPCTSITGDNLQDCLWTELAKWLSKSKVTKEFFTHTASRVEQKQHPDTWFAVARAWPKQADPTQQANTLAGFHADYLLFIIDEAGGIPDSVTAAAEASQASGIETKMLVCGNKTHLSGLLYRAHTSERHLWHVMSVTGDPDDPDRSPRIDIEEARSQIAKLGRNNDVVRVNILNEFPKHQSDAMVSLGDVDAAVKRVLLERDWKDEPRILGVDVSAGGDCETTFVPRQGLNCYRIESQQGEPDTMKVVAMVCDIIVAWKPDAIFVDDSGVGKGVCDRLRELGHPAQGVDAAAESSRSDVALYNRRTQMWWDMAQWMRTGTIPDDPILRGQLPGPKKSFDGHGRIKLETKDEMKRRGLKSPDRADGLAYTFAYPVAIRRQQTTTAGVVVPGRAAQGHCATGFTLKTSLESDTGAAP